MLKRIKVRARKHKWLIYVPLKGWVWLRKRKR